MFSSRLSKKTLKKKWRVKITLSKSIAQALALRLFYQSTLLIEKKKGLQTKEITKPKSKKLQINKKNINHKISIKTLSSNDLFKTVI